MTFRKDAFVNFIILTIAFTDVASWTIDLPEVRKFLFEKYEKESKNGHDDYLNEDQKLYSNIEGNSKHHASDEKHRQDFDKDADEYGYHAYMEKKVYSIVRDGSSYLEGLRRSLEDYNMFLESCNRQNSARQNTTTSNNATAWRPQYEDPSSRTPSFNTSNNSTNQLLNFQNYDNFILSMRPNSSSDMLRPIMRNRSSLRMTCREATEASERVRRYAELAMYATKRLQDLAYAKKYQKADEQEENELILKLAWFLDRLAYLTGYEPDYKEYQPTGTKSPTTIAPTPLTMVPSSEEMRMEFMECIRRNSSEPATVRCRYPPEMIPELLARMFTSTDSGTIPSSEPSSDSVIPMNGAPDNIQSSEILITSASTSPKSSITKRSTEYTYYYPSKPIHELPYPAPILKLIKHRLSNIKAIVKTLVEKRIAHIAEKNEEKKHFEKRSIDDSNVESLNFIKLLSGNPKPIVKLEKQLSDGTASTLETIHYPVSDVSVTNTKSFKKRSIDSRRITSNHINRLSNLKSVVKSVEKGSFFKKMVDSFLSTTNQVKRMSKNSLARVKSIKKRSSDDPMSKLANYYIKYKVWDISNPIHRQKNFYNKMELFEVTNHLVKPKTIHKRSLLNKKVIHLHAPKPLQIIRTYIQGHRHHITQKPKLLIHLQKLHDLKHKKLEKINHKIKKRSLHHEHVYLPRIPMDPQGDISYYIKNKEGTNINPDLIQAGQVRLGLEQVFQIGNIEVIRRFGANYNPLNPAPFYTGVLASVADS